MLTAGLLLFASCKKQDEWLDRKNTKSDVSPSTLQDFQAVLDNTTSFNGQGSVMGLMGADNLYITETALDAEDQVNRNAYLWAKDIYNGTTAYDWYNDYRVVEFSNIVLEGLAKIKDDSESPDYRNVKGSALFYRAYAFYQLCQLYCKPYIAATAADDPGIPLRQSSDVNQRVQRSTVADAYELIIGDLKAAALLLPEIPLYRTRPSTVAVNALLAKIYLSMRDYDNAQLYADAALQRFPALLDYNTLTITTADPFPTFAKSNPEIIYYANCQGYLPLLNGGSSSSRISPDLFQTYESSDLRKTAYYAQSGTTGYYFFKGSYAASGYLFDGFGTDELYLIRAECAARRGDLSAALNDLNLLLKNRYQKTLFVPVSIADQDALVSRILLERRKELPYMANTRWDDLRRLNQESRFAVTLTRLYHGVTYTLEPNDNRYVLPIPDDEIHLEGLAQNPR